MKCDQTELLLAGYADLSETDRARVDEHVQGCSACAASLAAYRELEGLLLERREERSPATETARRVVGRLGLARRSPILGVVTLVPRLAAMLTELPGIIATSLVGAGVFLLFAGDSVRQTVTGFGNAISERLPTAFSQQLLAVERATNSLNAATTGQDWMVPAVYLSLFLVIAAAGGWMVLKFVRE